LSNCSNYTLKIGRLATLLPQRWPDLRRALEPFWADLGSTP
jgi:hypothetical protein